MSEGTTRNGSFEVRVGDRALEAREGQTVAAVLCEAGIRVLRSSPAGEPRGLFCAMGVCFECLVTVDGVPDQRACVTPVRPGMQIELQVGENHGEG